MKSTSTTRIEPIVAAFLALAFLLLAGTTLAAPAVHAWVNGTELAAHDVWQPSPANYVNGNPKGFTEGDTAPFRVTIDGTSDAQELQFIVCLDFDDSGAYGFTAIENWDTSYTPATPPTALSGATSGFQAENATIDAITALGEAGGSGGQNCPANYLGWLVQFTVTNASLDSYIVYGGHLAAEGDPLPGGGTVPADGSASDTGGVFQARIISANSGDKTINFQSNDITAPTAVTLADFGADDSGWRVPVIGLVILLLITTAFVLFSRARRQPEAV
jgi:hypothetical protein